MKKFKTPLTDIYDDGRPVKTVLAVGQVWNRETDIWKTTRGTFANDRTDIKEVVTHKLEILSFEEWGYKSYVVNVFNRSTGKREIIAAGFFSRPNFTLNQ